MVICYYSTFYQHVAIFIEFINESQSMLIYYVFTIQQRQVSHCVIDIYWGREICSILLLFTLSIWNKSKLVLKNIEWSKLTYYHMINYTITIKIKKISFSSRISTKTRHLCRIQMNGCWSLEKMLHCNIFLS